jgi:4-hydroxy-tetrahydrodipicolinate synthase
MKAFTGTAVALITPFNAEHQVDVLALKKLVRYNIESGIDYLVVLGTTAETATLSEAEQELVIETVVRENAAKLPLVLGMGGNDTLSLVHKIRNTNLSDFSAILSVTPYYNKPTQEGLEAHFNAVAQASPIPVIIYNVPSRTGVNMLAKTSLNIARKNKNVIGIKEACGDLSQIAQLISGKEEDFLVISGDDATAYQTTLAGGAGVISVIGQAIPKVFNSLIKGAIEGHKEEDHANNEALQPLIQSIFEEGNPAGIKALLSVIGDYPTDVRLPLLPATQGLQDKLRQQWHDFELRLKSIPF